jgi:hypothetical protein
MSTTATYKRTYRAPTVEPEVEAVSLSQFDIEDIREYLHRYDTGTLRGPAGDPRESTASTEAARALVVQPTDLDRIETLALCGQLEHARAEVLRIVSDHIGRPL